MNPATLQFLDFFSSLSLMLREVLFSSSLGSFLAFIAFIPLLNRSKGGWVLLLDFVTGMGEIPSGTAGDCFFECP